MADTANRKPFRSDDDLPAEGPGEIDPLLELSQIAGFEPEDDTKPDEQQIDLEDALLAELTPQQAPAAGQTQDPAAPVDLPPFIGGVNDIDTVAVDEASTQAMEDELSPPLPDPAPSMDAWPPSPPEAEATPPAPEPPKDVPAFLSTPAPEPEPAPAAPSLEDELAAMLAGDTTPAPMPSAEPPVSDEQVDPFDPMPEDAVPAAADESVLPAAPGSPEQDAPVAAGILPVPEPVETMQAPESLEPAPAEDTVPDVAAMHEPVERSEQSALDEVADAHSGMADWTHDLEASPASEATGSGSDAAGLDADFAAAFDDELSADFDAGMDVDPFNPPASDDATPADDLHAERPTVDPVDELAAIMGYEPPADPNQAVADTDVRVDTVERTLDAMDADFQSALDADLTGDLSVDGDVDHAAPAAGAVAPPSAPVLDTVDMSSFENVPTSDFDVPEFERDDVAPNGAPADQDGLFHDPFDREPFAVPSSDEPAAGGAGATATATTLGGEFDSAQFEAELARDMEFVSHDLNTERDADGLDLDAVEDTAAPAQADRSGRRGMVIGLVVAGLAIAGVTGVLALSGGGDAVDDGPVLVEADDTPVKIEPDDPGGTTVPNQDRAVFADGDSAAPAQENLVSTAEEPVDIATAPTDSLPSAVASGEKAEDRLTEGGTEASASDAVTPITPRRVRTLIVRPDGTLEERAPEPVESAAAETVPAVPEQAAPQSAPVVNAPQTVAGVPVTDATVPATPADDDAAAPGNAAAAQAPAAPANAEQTAGGNETAPVVVRRVQTTTATPPLIRDRPSDQPVNVVNRQQVAAAPAATSAPAPTQQAAAPAPQAATPVTTTSGSTGISVQLAALPSEAAARATATRLSQQYGGLIDGRGLTIQRAVIEGRGTFYRVRVAANGSGDANALCNSIKASGGNCFVAR
ncbi:MAG: SPOR domain-containing protein [Roseitalea sp.]|jgi:hypothetical protein|nr:SPOR domain-containing protein [Roseitalea sp.]MBO6721749.1 SPOR domain-containing protein [Roseitalea sp.]MBO6741643.1 SPOR domain-containing protein [Roseitalea sp.]